MILALARGSILAQAVDPGMTTAWDLVTDGGLVGLLFLVVFAFLREWVFTGAAYRRKEQEAEQWKQIALASMNVTDKAVTMVDRP